MTGVASGGIGTGANLDDTQVFRTEDLAEAAASPPEPPASAAPQAGVPVSAASAPVAEPIARPVPVAPVRPTVVPRGTSANRRPGRGLAGLLAAALVVLAGVAFMFTRDDGALGAGQAIPSAAASATAAPDANAGGGGGNDPGDDGGNGKDKDKPCNGNGRGKGCEGDDD